jgi:hypothetical protein
MREAFAHDAVVVLDGTGDLGVLGAAVTTAVCGSWEHEPPCPLAPHHTRAERRGDGVHVRTLFAVDPAQEPEVRRRIESALSAGSLPASGASPAVWRLLSSAPGIVRPDEEAHAERLRGI